MACFNKYFHSHRIVALRYTQMNADTYMHHINNYDPTHSGNNKGRQD